MHIHAFAAGALAVSLSLSPAAGRASPPSDTAVGYVNHRYAYRLALPPGWTTPAGPADTEVRISAAPAPGVALRLVAATLPLPPPDGARRALPGTRDTHALVLDRLLRRDGEHASRTYCEFKISPQEGAVVAGSITSHYAVVGRAVSGEVTVTRVAVCSCVRAGALWLYRLQATYPMAERRGSAAFRTLVDSLKLGLPDPGGTAPERDAVAGAPGSPGLVARPPSVSVTGSPAPHPEGTLRAEGQTRPAYAFFSKMRPMSAADTKAMVDNFSEDPAERTAEEQGRARIFLTGGVMRAGER